MNLWKTLVLAAIVAVVGFYIAKVEVPKDEQKRKAELLFPDLNVDDLKTLSIKAKDVDVTFLQEPAAADSKKAEEGVNELVDVDLSRWKIEGLPHAALDKATLNALVSALFDLKREYDIPAADVEKDLTVYGLKEPALSVGFSSATKSVSLLIGKESEMLKKRYMKMGDSDAVFMGASSFYQTANKKREDFRDKTPVDFFDSQLTKLELDTEKVDTIIEATANLGWRILSPVAYSASNTAVTDFLRNLRNLQAAEFIDEPKALKEYGLEKPFITTALSFNEASKREASKIKIGKSAKGDAFYLTIEGMPTVYKLAADPSALLNKQLDDFREKQPFKFQYDEVVSAEFQPKDGEKIAFTRDGDEWKVNGKAGDGPFVKNVLDQLSGLTAESFPVDTRDYGLSTPYFTWTVIVKEELSDNKEEKKLTLVAGSPTDEKATKRYAATGDLSDAFIVGTEALAKITPRVDTLLKPEPTPSESPAAQSAAAVATTAP